MKSLEHLWSAVAMDFATRCRTSTNRDAKTVADRVKCEGISFLTITLPAFGKDFEQALAQEQVSPSHFCGFHSRGGILPLFLGGFLELVFDATDGSLLPQPSEDAVYAIRQLTLMFSKIELKCTERRTRAAIKKFVETDREMKEHRLTSAQRNAFQAAARTLFSDIFNIMEAGLTGDQWLENLPLPKHGPGKTADGLSGNQKFYQREWTQRLEKVFPFGEYCLPNNRFHKRLADVRFLSPRTERPVKVVSVPKTLKTPRLIAIEPTCMQYAQQSLATNLVSLIEGGDSDFLSSQRSILLQGIIGFSDQEPNKDLAKRGSADGSLATLDLSEASDRVKVVHVADLLKNWPTLRKAVFACRSTKAQVPGHGIIHLSKFASMGSALCFPMEAMVFTTLVFMGICEARGVPLTRNLIKSMKGKVRIYGDDIVVPVDTVDSVLSYLESYGFRVNANKSFWTGKFRESCGGDYYGGVDVTPVRVRHTLPKNRLDVKSAISLVEFRNLAYKAGLWNTARILDTRLERVFEGKYPRKNGNSDLLGGFTYLPLLGEKVCPDLHRPISRGYVVSSKPPKSLIEGEGALLKHFLKRGDEPFADERHLERQGRPVAVSIKLRWRATSL